MKNLFLEHLVFGYCFDYKPRLSFVTKERSKNVGSSLTEIDKRARIVTRKSFEACLNKSKGKHIVPLSSGRDSRFILANLLEFLNTDEIETFTYGVRGSYDAELGIYISHTLGIKNTFIDLSMLDQNISDLSNALKICDWQTLPGVHGPIEHQLKSFSDSTIWSGAAAGLVTGSFFEPNDYKKSREETINKFIKKNVNIAYNRVLKEETLLRSFEEGWKRVDGFTPFEEITLGYHTEKHLLPHVMFSGLNYQNPFINSELMDFFISLPENFRYNQNYYKTYIRSNFPDFFDDCGNYPVMSSVFKLKHQVIQRTKSNVARKLINRWPFFANFNTYGLNYLNFQAEIANRTKFGNQLVELAKLLAKRKNVPFKLDKTMSYFISYPVKHYLEILKMAKLELLIQSKEV